MLQFRVNGQSLERIDEHFTADRSAWYLSTEFEFSDDWCGTEKTVIFKVGEAAYSVPLDGDVCAVPNECVANGVKCFYVSVFGNKQLPNGHTQRITTNNVKVAVRASGFTEGRENASSGEIATDYERLLTNIALKVDKEEGKGLSSNDFTDAYRDMLDSTGNEAARQISTWAADIISGAYAYSRKPVNVDAWLEKNGYKIVLQPVRDEYLSLLESDDIWKPVYKISDTEYTSFAEYLIYTTPDKAAEISFTDKNGQVVDVDMISGSLSLSAGVSYAIHLYDGICIVEEV